MRIADCMIWVPFVRRVVARSWQIMLGTSIEYIDRGILQRIIRVTRCQGSEELQVIQRTGLRDLRGQNLEPSHEWSLNWLRKVAVRGFLHLANKRYGRLARQQKEGTLTQRQVAIR